MIKAIIFDCFGVVYPDTLSYVERAFISLDDPRIDEIKQIRRQCDVGLLSREEFWNQAAKIIGISRTKLDQKLDEVKGADWELLSYIKQLKKSYKTAMLSNVGRGFLELIFDKKRPQSDYFDVVIASADIEVAKPDHRAYLAVCKTLSVDPSECVFVDDLERNASGAKEVGMQAILYQNFDQMKAELDKILAKT